MGDVPRSSTIPPEGDGQLRTHALAKWDDSGLVWFRGAITKSQVSKLDSWATEISAWPDTPGKWLKYYEALPVPGSLNKEKALSRVENFLPFHDALRDFVEQGSVKLLIEDLVGGPMLLFKDKINLRPPGSRGFELHQDAHAYAEFGVMHHVTAMIPVDAFDATNGAMRFGRRPSDGLLLPTNPDRSIRPELAGDLDLGCVYAEPGDIVVFDSLVPHDSSDNKSRRARRAYFFTFADARLGDRRSSYFQAKRTRFPQECELSGFDVPERADNPFNLGNPYL